MSDHTIVIILVMKIFWTVFLCILATCSFFFFFPDVQIFNEVCFLEKEGGEELRADNTVNGVI